MDVTTWPIKDLFLVPSEDFEEEDGEMMHCVFSQKLDAVTFVCSHELLVLQKRGAGVLDTLPNDSV